MNNIISLIDTPSISNFLDNPIQSLSAVITGSFGFVGYILILFLLIGLVWAYNKNVESIGIFVVLFGAGASLLYPIIISIIMLVLGVGVIFGSVLWKSFFKSRGEY